MKIQIPVYLDDLDCYVSEAIDDALVKKFNATDGIISDSDQIKYDLEYNELYNLTQDILEEKSLELYESPAIILEVDTDSKTLELFAKPSLTVLDEQKSVKPILTTFSVPKLEKL